MADTRLYTVSVPDGAKMNGQERGEREVSDIGAIAGGSTAVTSLGLSAGERTLRVQYKGYNDAILGEMLAELAESETLETVPYFGVNPDGTRDHTKQDGYYTVSRVTDETPDQRSESYPTVDLTMKKKGTRNSHWRYEPAKPTASENQFGNDTTEYIGVPAAATKVRWHDRDINLSGATPASTVTTEFGDVDIYHGSDSPYSSLSLIYDLPYNEEGKTDVAVWDTRGAATKTDTVGGEAVLEWSKVFHTYHDFRGSATLSNGRVRLTVDEDNQSLSAEEYTSGSWSDVALGASDWQILDLDITTIDYSRIAGTMEFEDSTDGSIYRLNFVLRRGATGFIFYIPDNLTSTSDTGYGIDYGTDYGTGGSGTQEDVPQGLKDLLDPIASPYTVLMNTNQTVRKRSEVRG